MKPEDSEVVERKERRGLWEGGSPGSHCPTCTMLPWPLRSWFPATLPHARDHWDLWVSLHNGVTLGVRTGSSSMVTKTEAQKGENKKTGVQALNHLMPQEGKHGKESFE